MSQEIFSSEPLLQFIRERQYLKNANLVTEIARMGLVTGWSEPENRHFLQLALAPYIGQIPEAQFLEHLLTNTQFLSPSTFTGRREAQGAFPSELYLPAPGLEDATPLTPLPSTSGYIEAVPPAQRRTMGWLLTNGQPTVLVLTYDPLTLQGLRALADFWMHRAAIRRPDHAGYLSNPNNVVIGWTSLHQYLSPAKRWRKLDLPPATRSMIEGAGLDPYHISELTLYCWAEKGHTPSERDIQRLSDLALRRIVVRPRLYASHIPSEIAPTPPPEVRLMNASAAAWRRHFEDLVEACAEDGDSDIHLLPSANGGYNIMRRTSGHLCRVAGIPSVSATHYLGAALANSDIELAANPSIPHDGRASLFLRRLRRQVDLRISTSAGANGNPAVVFRIQDPSTIQKGIEEILITEEDRARWELALNCSHGILLVTGPTGSGKSRTLYAYQQSLHARRPDLAFKSAEHPIELRLGDWIQQNEVRHEAGATFERILRALLRQDPDVIFIGEIRDAETAQIAVHAALTGHLVIASLHSTSTAHIMDRMGELGVNPRVLKSLLRFATAQTLLGRSCPHCREVTEIPPHILAELGNYDGTPTALKNTGCPKCNGFGVRGRFAVHEYLVCTEEDLEMQKVLETADSASIAALQRSRGFRSLHQRKIQFAVGANALTNLDEAISL